MHLQSRSYDVQGIRDDRGRETSQRTRYRLYAQVREPARKQPYKLVCREEDMKSFNTRFLPKRGTRQV